MLIAEAPSLVTQEDHRVEGNVMPERARFRLSIMADATMPTHEMSQRVETALGCSFRKGDFQGGLPAYLTDLLG